MALTMTFKDKVLQLTKKIPKGKVTTYRIIAEKLGTKAYRAVGTALRNNDSPIIIPCHRVVNSNGDIGKYKGSRKYTCEKVKILRKEGIMIKNDKVEYLSNVIYRF